MLHVGFVLAAFAGFTLAAALAVLYLWEERRLKRRAADILRLRLPPLASLERAVATDDLRSRCRCLTLGLAAGVVRLRQEGDGFDALDVLAIGTWLVYGSSSRRARQDGARAYLALGGFALVAVARLALARSHFA